MPGKNSVMVPPETIPNSEVKHFNADGITGFPRVRVGNYQATHKKQPRVYLSLVVFYVLPDIIIK